MPVELKRRWLDRLDTSSAVGADLIKAAVQLSTQLRTLARSGGLAGFGKIRHPYCEVRGGV